MPAVHIDFHTEPAARLALSLQLYHEIVLQVQIHARLLQQELRQTPVEDNLRTRRRDSSARAGSSRCPYGGHLDLQPRRIARPQPQHRKFVRGIRPLGTRSRQVANTLHTADLASSLIACRMVISFLMEM